MTSDVVMTANFLGQKDSRHFIRRAYDWRVMYFVVFYTIHIIGLGILDPFIIIPVLVFALVMTIVIT